MCVASSPPCRLGTRLMYKRDVSACIRSRAKFCLDPGRGAIWPASSPCRKGAAPWSEPAPVGVRECNGTATVRVRSYGPGCWPAIFEKSSKLEAAF